MWGSLDRFCVGWGYLGAGVGWPEPGSASSLSVRRQRGLVLGAAVKGIDGLRGATPSERGTAKIDGRAWGLGGEVPLLLRRGSRRDKWRGLGRQVDALQIAPDRCGVGQCGDEVQPSSTIGADGHIEGEDAR